MILGRYALLLVWIDISKRFLEGSGNGNPLQYSRVENPMDGGAW